MCSSIFVQTNISFNTLRNESCPFDGSSWWVLKIMARVFKNACKSEHFNEFLLINCNISTKANFLVFSILFHQVSSHREACMNTYWRTAIQVHEEKYAKFSQHHGLIRHRRSHTEERPFKSEKCGTRFNQSSSLTAHAHPWQRTSSQVWRMHSYFRYKLCKHFSFNQKNVLKIINKKGQRRNWHMAKWMCYQTKFLY